MKKTFLDNVSNAKTFLIYGNVLDEYCTPDLCLRTFDEYLVKLLFSRGYKRVIFTVRMVQKVSMFLTL